MWLPGASVGGEDLTAKSAKGAKMGTPTTKTRRVQIIGKGEFQTRPYETFVNFVPSW